MKYDRLIRVLGAAIADPNAEEAKLNRNRSFCGMMTTAFIC